MKENNITTSAHFDPTIHLTPQKIKNTKNSQKESLSKKHKGDTTGNNTAMDIDRDEEDSQNTIRLDDTTKKGDDITQNVENPLSKFKLIIVILTVAPNILTSEDIAVTQQVIDPSTKSRNKLMNLQEALQATNTNTILLPWSTKDKRKLDNTTKAILKL